jgi:hypothetical protein
MKHYQRDGIDFVTDLVWQSKLPSEKFNLKLYRKDCAFDFYCKTNKLGHTYGFGRYPRDDDNKIAVKLKKPVSLGLFIIESVDIGDADSNVNLFICFCFDNSTNNQTYGYVFIYNGTILPEDGEYVGSLDEVKAKIKQLSKQYNAEVAFIPDDVPFYNDLAFEYESKLKIYPLASKLDEKTGEMISASEHIFWQQNKQKSRVCSIKNLDNTKQKKAAFYIGLLIIAGAISYGAKEYFYPDISIDDLSDEVVAKPTAYPAKVFINKCLAKSNLFVFNTSWQLTNFSCTDKGINVTYKSDDGKLQELENQIKQKVKYQNGIATAHLNIDLPDNVADQTSQVTDDVIDALQDAAIKMEFTATINGNKFDISSGYSPVFLYENNIIDKLNLSEISMVPDTSSGFMNWKILGEFNAQQNN